MKTFFDNIESKKNVEREHSNIFNSKKSQNIENMGS